MEKTKILILPHAGGNPLMYKHLQEAFSLYFNCEIIQYPNRPTSFKGKPNTTIQEYSSALENTISKLDEEHIILFGHSMGGLIAYDYLKTASFFNNKKIVLAIISSFDFENPPVNLINLKKEERFRLLRKLLEKTEMIPLAMIEDKKFLDFVIPPLENDLLAINHYRNDGREIDVPLIVSYGADDVFSDEKGMESWRNYTFNKVKFLKFSGNHFYFINKEIEVSKSIFKLFKEM